MATVHLRAAAAVCLALDGETKPLLGRARRDVAALERERLPWSLALAKLIRAAIQNRSGDSAACANLLADASDELDRAAMPAYAAAARFWRTRLQNDSPGQNAAIEELQAMGVRNPERMAAMLVPGFE